MPTVVRADRRTDVAGGPASLPFGPLLDSTTGGPVIIAARTHSADDLHAGPLRRVLSAICLVLPALAVLAFGGQLLISGWFDGRLDGTSHAQDLAWGSAEGILLFVALATALPNGRRTASLQQAIAVVAALLATMALTLAPEPVTLVVGVFIVTGVVLSPGRSLLVRRTAPVNRPMAGLALVASGPLIAFAVSAASAQRQGGSPHSELFGYTGATVWALAVLGVVSVAAMRMRGWRTPAISAAAAVSVMGVAGVLWPTIPSSLGTLGGVAALVWAFAVLAVVVFDRTTTAQVRTGA